MTPPPRRGMIGGQIQAISGPDRSARQRGATPEDDLMKEMSIEPDQRLRDLLTPLRRAAAAWTRSTRKLVFHGERTLAYGRSLRCDC